MFPGFSSLLNILLMTIHLRRKIRQFQINVEMQNRSTEGCSKLKRSEVQERMVSTLEQMQVPNGTGPGVRRSKRPLLASRTRCNFLWKPPTYGYKVKIGNKIQFYFHKVKVYGRKGRDLTQPYDKSPYNNRHVKRAK